MKEKETFYTGDRAEWREWLLQNFETKTEIWLVFPTKSSGEPALSYKRIRVAYIDAARKRPDEFTKRLNSFLSKTRENKLIVGFGGIDKYYK